MAFGFKITAQALRDLKGIEGHIRLNDPSEANDFCNRLLEFSHSLTTFPFRHGSWAKKQQIGKVPFDAYLIFYKIHDEEKVVEILRFWHAARDQGRLRLREQAATAYTTPATA